jgi:hypothetical protein
MQEGAFGQFSAMDVPYIQQTIQNAQAQLVQKQWADK